MNQIETPFTQITKLTLLGEKSLLNSLSRYNWFPKDLPRKH